MDSNKQISYEESLNLVTLQAEEIKELKEELNKVLKENEKLKLYIAMGNARTFKPKSEVIDKEEATLFNYNEVEANASTTIEKEQENLETEKPRKKKSKNHQGIDLESLVSEVVVHEDTSCGHDQLLISEDFTYKAEVKLDIKVIKHIFKTTKCVECDKINTPLREFPFNNSIATPSLVSYVANEKFFMGTPLYRQENAFLNAGFPMSRVNLSNYLIKTAAILLPYYEYLKYLLINNEKKVLHADETTLKVINVGNKDKKDKSYVWLYTTSIHDLPIYIYEYRYSRHGQWPRDFLKDYKGCLVVDDYAGYNNIPNVKLQKCFAHARRKFVDIYKANNDPKVKHIIDLIDEIFEVEKAFRDKNLPSETIKELRNSPSYLEKLNAYFEHLESTNYSETSVTGKAVNYSLKLKKELMTYLEDGNIPIDNNLVERGVKAFVINRKNFLFSNTEKGARASTILMSIIFTAKANGLNTYQYLEYLIEEIYKLKLFSNTLSVNQMKQMEHLLPWNEEIKSQFMVKEVSR